MKRNEKSSLAHPQLCRPEIAMAELDRAHRALENWGASCVATPEGPPPHCIEFHEVCDLYLCGLKFFDDEQVWSAEHLARAVQHFARAGWHQARLLWRESQLSPLPRCRTGSCSEALIVELRDLEDMTSALLQALRGPGTPTSTHPKGEAEPPRPLPLPLPSAQLLARLTAGADLHRAKAVELKAHLDSTPRHDRIHPDLAEQSKDHLSLAWELVQGVSCLQLAWEAATHPTTAYRSESTRSPCPSAREGLQDDDLGETSKPQAA